MSFDITKTEISSFDGGFYRPTVINGPITLVRFSDSGRGDPGRYGRFWLYGDEVKEILAQGAGGMATIKEISQRWAICDDWGDKQICSLMDIPASGGVPAYWGRARAQPKVSDPNVRQTNHSYTGGSLQLIIPVSDTERPPHVNATIAAYITRKLTTAQIIANPALALENPWVTAQRRKGKNI